MIITKQKELNKILEKVKDKKDIFIVGCAACATKCATGGEDQVNSLKNELKKNHKNILGTIVLDTPCDMRIVKKELTNNSNIKNSNCLVLLCCGAGVQSVAQVIEDKELIPALDTLFLGTMERLGNFYQYCSLCGECIIDETEGICPLTRCAKALVNGPCGGAIDSKCEIDTENDCAWVLIYQRLKNNPNLRKYHNLKNYANISKPQKMVKK